MHSEPDCLPEVSPDVWPVGKKAAFFTLGLAVLFAILDFADRQVLAALFPYLKAEYALSDTQLGMLVSIVNISIAVLVMPTGYMVDRWSRKYMMGIMTFTWSIATAACAFAGSYSHLLAARFFVGAGESGYSPAAQSLLAASFPGRLRTTVMAIFLAACSIGAPLGLITGAFIAEHWSWRHAFGVVALPGVFGAFLCLFIKDFKTVKPACSSNQDSAEKAIHRESWGSIVCSLLSTPSLLLIFFAQASHALFVSVIMNWAPSYFQREGGMPATRASLISAIILISIAITAMCYGPFLDRLRSRAHTLAIKFEAITAFVGFALIFSSFAFMSAGSTMQVVLLVGGLMIGGSLMSLGYTLTSDLTLPHHRGTAISLLVTTQNILGMGLGPLLAGLLSDHLSLGTSIMIMSGFYVIVGVLYTILGKTYNRDFAKLEKVVVEF